MTLFGVSCLFPFLCLSSRDKRVNAIKAIVFCFGGLFGKNLSYSEFVEQLK